MVLNELSRLAAASPTEQEARGYRYTLSEILQQPDTWDLTSEIFVKHSGVFAAALEGIRLAVLTGSGSSEFVGDCLRLGLRSALKIPVQVIAGGALLTDGIRATAPLRPGLMISFARSGDSPESTAAIAEMLVNDPGMRHLAITCSARGKLASQFRDDDRVQVFTLDDRTNDRSLVMTSSFTNMLLAAQGLTALGAPREYLHRCQSLATMCRNLFLADGDLLARMARLPFRRVVFLGSGSHYGAARESALKMLEMTSGRVSTMCETYLGLRHGPLSYIDDETLVVCFLSSDPRIRRYESDLIAELNQKNLGLGKLLIGDAVPQIPVRRQDAAVECPGLAAIGDDNAPMIDVVVGQLLAFFRCMQEELRPDSPSESGVISRVVGDFKVHTVSS